MNSPGFKRWNQAVKRQVLYFNLALQVKAESTCEINTDPRGVSCCVGHFKGRICQLHADDKGWSLGLSCNAGADEDDQK